MSEGERRLAAIMYTDIVGYTSLTQKDESFTLQALEKHRSLLRPLFSSHGGREVKTMGDAFLIEFQSALDAVLCAVAIQQTMHDRKVARGEQLSLRIGIHVGDVVESGGDILGDAVNIASRIEPLAEPGAVCVTSQVYEHVRNKSDLQFTSLGEKSLKNVSRPVEVYKVAMPWEEPAPQPETAFSPNRIAILPFVNFSPDPNDEYFANGMTEEVISTVSGISGLSVISRTSVMGYKGTTKRVEEIGRELRVGSVLEGSFRKAGNRIRVTTQLIDVAGDRHLWAQNYDRELGDVFAVQSDIAKQVADSLRVKILPREETLITRAPTNNSGAYSLYLKGRQLWNERTKEAIKKAIGCFEQAVADDPSFALGYSGLADCYYIFAGNWLDDPDANYPRVKEYVQRALRLDENLAEAHATLASLYLYRDWDFDEADSEFRKAIELKPSYSMAHNWYHLLLMIRGKWDQALMELKRALELDPFSIAINGNYASYLLFRGEYGRALEQYKKVVEMHPDSALAHGGLLAYYFIRRSHDEYRRELEVYSKLPTEKDPGSVMVWQMGLRFFEGEKEEVRKLLAEAESRRKELNFSPYGIGSLCILLGDFDEGFAWLELAYREHDAGLLSMRSDLTLDGVRSDRRYLDLLKRLGVDQTGQQN